MDARFRWHDKPLGFPKFPDKCGMTGRAHNVLLHMHIKSTRITLALFALFSCLTLESAHAGGLKGFLFALVGKKEPVAYHRVEHPSDHDFDLDLAIEGAREQKSIIDIVVSINSKSKRKATQAELIAIDTLIKAGAPVDERDGQWDSTSLMFAVQAGDQGLTRVLLDNGADPRAKNQNSDVDHYATTMEVLTQIAHAKNSVVTLIKAISGISHRLLTDEEREIAAELLAQGAPVDEKDFRWGSTSLMFAAQQGDTKTVLFLLQNGADTTLRGNGGKTALEFASSDVIRELLSN